LEPFRDKYSTISFGEYMGAALINSAKGVFHASANDFDCDLVDINSVIAGEIFADSTELISGRPLRSVSAREIAEADQ
jgi:hypothetical protein